MSAQPLPIPTDAEPSYVVGLNPEQREAVLAGAGPLLILAGAGTGKTRVLTTRLAHALLTGAVRPFEICAVTFTNKAGREMSERLAKLLGRSVEGLWLGTFHAIALRILRRHAELVGLQAQFTILDTDDQIRLLKQVLQAENIDEKRWPARQLLGVVQRWKDKGWRPDQVPRSEAGGFAGGRAIELYHQYQERLLTLNACDFGDLLLHNLTLFAQHGDILNQYQRRFKLMMVDEYQDTNVAQYLWLRLLAQEHKNLTVVGDDDQSIYSWRGAEVGNILRFEQDFPGAKVVRLERNYRSTGHILAAASGLIAKNGQRLGKTLWTEDSQGERVHVVGLWDDQEEARHVSDAVEAARRGGLPLNEAAILVRAGHQMRVLEERFIGIGLPYRVVGGPRFYERAEIRDAIAYLRIVNSTADDLAIQRIINTPRRGLGEATVQAVNRHARTHEIGFVQAARQMIQRDALAGRARNALGKLIDMIDRWRGIAQELSPRELCEQVLDESGYTAMWQNDTAPDAPGRLDNLKELARALDEFDTLGGFLEHVSLVMDNAADTNEQQVTLMTLHGAKGLEFDTVFLAGWEEGLFPNQRAMDEGGLAALEEERRLAYVGITRARRLATITFAANRRIYNNWSSSIPSRFIEELPDAHVHHAERRFTDSFEPSGWFNDVRPAYGQAERRAQAKQPRTIDAQAEVLTVSATESPRFSPGDAVRHGKFGPGTVEAVEGNKLMVRFDHAGSKKIVASFVEPA